MLLKYASCSLGVALDVFPGNLFFVGISLVLGMPKKCIAATVMYARPMLINNPSLPFNESITFDGVAMHRLYFSLKNFRVPS